MSGPAPNPVPTDRFFHVEAASGIALLSAATAALLWANSPWSAAYFHLFQLPLAVGGGHFVFSR